MKRTSRTSTRTKAIIDDEDDDDTLIDDDLDTDEAEEEEATVEAKARDEEEEEDEEDDEDSDDVEASLDVILKERLVVNDDEDATKTRRKWATPTSGATARCGSCPSSRESSCASPASW